MKKMILALTLVMILSFTGVAFADVDADSKAKASADANAFIQNNEAQQFMGLPTNFPVVIPLIQGGKVGDITAQLPKFAYVGLTPLTKDDKVVDLKVRLGSIFDRVRLEDIELDLIAFYKEVAGTKKWDPKKMRFLVQYKDSVMGAGIGGGGSAGASAINGGASQYGGAGSLSVLPGYTRSTADPMYVMKLYLIE
jgi:hypothetical protein